jgi:hypothetical protein
MKKQKESNMKTTLQVPIRTLIKKKAEEKAIKEGFDSLQAFTRLVITKYAEGDFSFNLQTKEEYEIASPELEERIEKAMESYKKGNHVTLKTKKEIDEYFDKLSKENE